MSLLSNRISSRDANSGPAHQSAHASNSIAAILKSPAEYARPGPHQLVDMARLRMDIQQALDLDYRLSVCDASMSFPFVLTPQLVHRALAFSTLPMQRRPREIFDYLCGKLEYGQTRRCKGYSSSIEVWENKQGVCGEMTYLFVALSRVAGLQSQYASVRQDHCGREVNHACAAVHLPRSGTVLVDIAYRAYNIKHRVWTAVADEEVWRQFLSWRAGTNARDAR